MNKQLTTQLSELLKEELKQCLSEYIKHGKDYLDMVKTLGLQNEQFVLDALDELNQLSIRF